MPANTARVRFEAVLERRQTRRAYYCGACDYSWDKAEDGSESDSTDPNRPDRSRSRR